MASFPRRYWFEIDDQPWFPARLRGYVQSVLLLAWNLKLPVVQSASAAAEAGNILLEQLPDPSNHSYVDLCAGAGGPTPTIERQVNARLQENGKKTVTFYLTDLHPHIESWTALSKQRENMSFIDRPVDATDAKELTPSDTKECRIFNLAFHHFDDPLAGEILEDTINSADAFAIFELQDRTFQSLLNVTATIFGTMVLTPVFYWRSPMHVFFTLVVPIVPAVLVFDGFVSSFRTRTPAEIQALMRRQEVDTSGWTFKHGRRRVLWPIGYLNWFIGTKRG